MNYSKPSTKTPKGRGLCFVIALLFLHQVNAFTDPSKTGKEAINTITSQIYFDLDESSPDAPTQVLEMVKSLKDQFGDQELHIKLTGRSCDLGPSDYNELLSQSRAFAVMELLMKKGLNINYIEIDGLGEEDPLAPNINEDNRKKNRSVSVLVVAGGMEQFLAAL